MNKIISIILLNYNWKKFNKDCIDSILLQSYKNFEIIFVDNASTDWSLEEIEKLYEKEINSRNIMIVKNKENTWFTGWNNLWVKYANKESKYICLLNNDTTVPRNWLEELVKWIESDEKLWAVWSIILDKWYEEKIKGMYLKKYEVYVSTILWETAKKKVSEQEIKSWIYYTTSLSWCSILYKKDILKEPFPEWYFAYWEDVFLCLNLIVKWHKLAFCTKSIVNHFWSWSFGTEPSDFKLFYWNRNQIINYLIFYKKITIIKLLPLFIITQFLQIFINVPFKRMKAKIKSRIWIINNWSKLIKLRNEIQKERKLSDKEFLNQLSYKFSDDVHYASFSEFKLNLIKIINSIFKFYCKTFF